VFAGRLLGCPRGAVGEVVFNTGMVGYLEALTDPSYKGQILVLTYPLIGNYGVPARNGNLPEAFESENVQISGLIVSEVCPNYSHWNAGKSFAQWLYEEGVPVLSTVDTRALTKHLRTKGSMLGRILVREVETSFQDPNHMNMVSLVSVQRPVVYSGGKRRLVLIDCGCKRSIIRSLLWRGVTVVRVPWDYDFLDEDFDGVVVSNGPGDPQMCPETILRIRRVLETGYPILGICLGHQILALAAGAKTYKLKFGHRGQNQPCLQTGNKRCFITSQNHGFAVDTESLPADWEPWFTNANDGTNEGLRHRSQPFMSVQFHPEAAPGPVDTQHIFDEFLQLVR
jgi:carbamoyl-phosphate synthase small subunit